MSHNTNAKKTSLPDALIEKHKALLVRYRKVDRLSAKEIASRLSSKTGEDHSRDTVYRALKKLGISGKITKAKTAPEITDNTEPSDELSIEELIEHRVRASKIKLSKHKRHNRSLELPPEPIGFLVMGDPHLDNDGCDFETLLKHIELTQAQDGVMVVTVGDVQDNWIGRLQRMYSESTIKASDGWRLSRWFLNSMNWLAIVGGNHDKWAHSAGVDPLCWIAESCGVLCYAPDELRLTLSWKGRPDLEPVVWIVRHDFRGRSWFHPTHGPHKEAMLDGRCHILTAGHIHQWGQLTTEQRHNRVTHSVRVRGYKRADAYAVEKGFYEQSFGESALIIIDPTDETAQRISVYWDLEKGYKILEMMRAGAL